MKMSAQAKKKWKKIQPNVQVKLLNNVWCSTCREMQGIGKISAVIKGGDLVLHGVCTKCGHEVARLIEG